MGVVPAVCGGIFWILRELKVARMSQHQDWSRICFGSTGSIQIFYNIFICHLFISKMLWEYRKYPGSTGNIQGVQEGFKYQFCQWNYLHLVQYCEILIVLCLKTQKWLWAELGENELFKSDIANRTAELGVSHLLIKLLVLAKGCPGLCRLQVVHIPLQTLLRTAWNPPWQVSLFFLRQTKIYCRYFIVFSIDCCAQCAVVISLPAIHWNEQLSTAAGFSSLPYNDIDMKSHPELFKVFFLQRKQIWRM